MPAHLDDREIGDGVRTDQRRGRGAAVGERDLELAVPAPPPVATWLLVRMSPSEERIDARSLRPRPWLPAILIMTTLGNTFCATACTDPSGAFTAGAAFDLGTLSELVTVVPVRLVSATYAPTAPPTPPLTNASASAPATIAVLPRGLRCRAAGAAVGNCPVG